VVLFLELDQLKKSPEIMKFRFLKRLLALSYFNPLCFISVVLKVHTTPGFPGTNISFCFRGFGDEVRLNPNLVVLRTNAETTRQTG
jgi:hypothetical protein